jgi:hypothetical protein
MQRDMAASQTEDITGLRSTGLKVTNPAAVTLELAVPCGRLWFGATEVDHEREGEREQLRRCSAIAVPGCVGLLSLVVHVRRLRRWSRGIRCEAAIERASRCVPRPRYQLCLVPLSTVDGCS